MSTIWDALKEAYLTDKIPGPAPVRVSPKGTCFIRDHTDPCIPVKSPDVLVEIGRDVASSLASHPERYAHSILGNQVLVVDDSSYEALFYLFSGRTRVQLYAEKNTVAALFLGRYCVMSTKLFEEAQRGAEGLW
jgi:hypothetical protein